MRRWQITMMVLYTAREQFRVVYKYAGKAAEGKAEAEKRIEPEPITARTREKEEQTARRAAEHRKDTSWY